MSVDSLAVAFRATVVLAFVALLLPGRKIERLTSASAHWLWFSVSLNTMVLFLHFSHPTTMTINNLAMYTVAGLYIITCSVRTHSVRLVLPCIGLYAVFSAIAHGISLFPIHERLFSLPTVLWLGVSMTAVLTAFFSPHDRLLALNLLALLMPTSRWFAKHFISLPLPDVSDATLFNVYWLCIVLTLLLNLFPFSSANTRSVQST